MASERLLRNAGLCRGVFDALRRLTETPYKGRFAELSERYEMGHFATGSSYLEAVAKYRDLLWRLRRIEASHRDALQKNASPDSPLDRKPGISQQALITNYSSLRNDPFRIARSARRS